jgi:methylase of polypeptide subunit release factors
MLAPGGVVAVETMAGAAPALAELMTDADLVDVEIDSDYGGIERVVSARRRP